MSIRRCRTATPPRPSRRRPALERLEGRQLLADLTVALDPALDQSGTQVLVTQSYNDLDHTTLGPFDTGSSAIALSHADQTNFVEGLGQGVPIKVDGGATVGGIGGTAVADVSEPSTIRADGLHALQMTIDPDVGLIHFDYQFDATSAAAQALALVGNPFGDLYRPPTVAGTPILAPSPDHPDGLAARVDMRGAQLDFSAAVPGLVLTLPDLHFVAPGTPLDATADTTAAVTVPLALVGADSTANPGDAASTAPIPAQPDVALAVGAGRLAHQAFAFDTGAQVTVISTAEATALGLDLALPETTVTVQGAAGDVTVPGFTLDELDLPLTDGGTLRFTHVPVYVLDLGGGVDGLLGMNLFDTASALLYDPYNPAGPSLSLAFRATPDRVPPLSPEGVDYLQSIGLLNIAGSVKGFQLPSVGIAAGEITGRVFDDRDRDGVQGADDPGLVGRVVFLDANGNGALDAGEARATTGTGGLYHFAGLAPGAYTVREVVPTGRVGTAPAGGARRVLVTGADVASGQDFAEADDLPPTAGDDLAATDQDVATTVAVLANDGDADGTLTPASVVIASGPAHGSAVADTAGRVVYTPSAGFVGQDRFTYTVADDTGVRSAPATVVLTVRPVNHRPVLGPLPDRSVDEGSPLVFDVAATDPDAGQHLRFSLAPGAPAGAVIDPITGRFSWTPADAPASRVVTVQVADDGTPSQVVAGSFLIRVNNVAPAVAAGADGASTVGRPFNRIVRFSDPGADTWIAIADYGDGTGPLPLTLAGPGALDLTHAYASAGSFRVTVAVRDDDGGLGTGTFLVTVTPPTAPLTTVPVIAPNGVAPRHSTVTNLVVGFSGPVSLSPGAFELENASGRHFGVDIAPLAGGTAVVVRFRGRGVRRGVLPAGRYTLVLHGDRVADASGRPLDGDGDGIQGGDRLFSFFRRAGDRNGDGRVDRRDLPARRVKSGSAKTLRV